MSNTNLKKNFIWNTIGGFTAAISSLFYTLVLTRLSDLNTTGLYTIAFAIACTMVTLASFGGRTYQVTDTKNEISPFSYIISRYFTVGITIILLIIYLFIKDYDVGKFFVILAICLFKFLEEVSDVYYGVLQKNDYLYKVGIFQFTKSFVNILLFTLLTILWNNLFISFFILFLINILFLIFVERKSASLCNKWKFGFSKAEIIKYFKANVLICILTFLTTYIVNCPKYAIDSILTNDLQAIFGIIVMPATVMLLVGNFILNPFIVSIAEKYNENKIKELSKLLFKVFGIMFLIGVAVFVVCFFIGIPLLNLIYGINLDKYKTSLLIIIVGSVFYAVTAGISTTLVAMRIIKIQVIGNLIVILFAFMSCNYLVENYGVLGASMTYMLLILVRFIIYVVIMIFSLMKRKKSITDESLV